MKTMEFINVNNIYPHPNNPRKDLGDLTELAESIKANGIFQNLTVVPWVSQYTGKPADNGESDGDYTVIIGHRRLAAAKLAGLTEVPCVITQMTEKEQLATMLLENMQRSDLTIYEQAQGFQMMLDLGETINNISEKTGFSETTVRHRVKLLELDQDKFRDSVTSGATIQDFIELEKIKDINLRNEVLKSIGTQNYKWTLNNALSKEKMEANKPLLIEQIETFATRTENSTGLQYTKWISYHEDTFVKPDDIGTVKYYFTVSENGIYLYKEMQNTSSADTSAADEEKKKMQQRRAQLNGIGKTAFGLRYEFIKNITGTKKRAKDIIEFAIRSMMKFWDFEEEMFVEMLRIEPGEDEKPSFEMIQEEFTKSPERILLLAAYCLIGDNGDSTYHHSYDLEYQENNELNMIYTAIEKLGYQMSDEERTLRDGTHELLTREDAEPGDGDE